MSVLKIIDNPMQDIPLVTVLRSPIGEFSDNDLMQIRLKGRKKEQTYFYETLLEAKNNDEELNIKIEKFLNLIKNFRQKKEYLPLDELIWQIYLETGFYNYVGLMPNGAIRQANLKMLFERAKEYEKASFKGLFNFIIFIDKLKTSNQDMDSAKIIGENEDVIRIMSIHKSKGLEFPVVFLCNTGKKFNMMDLNNNILIHQDIGFGPKYIDYERKIEYNTLAKLAIGYKIKQETISEEMRILYVALTRAKEKLIITGISNDLEKDMQEKQELLQMESNKKINPNIIKRYKSYLDWLKLVYLKNESTIKDIVELHSYTKEELIKKWKNEEKDETSNICDIEETVKKYAENKNNTKEQEESEAIKDRELNKLLNWKYKNILATQIQANTSVTKLKENITSIELKEKYKVENMKKPLFLQDNLNVTRAEIGTLTHLCIQKMNEKQDYDYKEIVDLIQNLVTKEIITLNQANAINVDGLLKYVKSDLYKELKTAKKVYKEQPFYINIPADEVYGQQIDENILVQGVIDLYYIDKNDKIILVDYKTDFVKNNEQELIEKYKKQLTIYKRALEKALEKEVNKVYIYSVYLGKSIEIK